MDVYSAYRQVRKYLSYYLTAANGKGHGMHSPFIFDFITTVLNDKQAYPDYETVEQLRQRMLNDKRILSVTDFGAGSMTDKSDHRTIASIAKNAAKPAKYSQLLYRMIRKYKPAAALELGTSLGITTTYLALANPGMKLVTMEGSPAVAEIARQNFKDTGLDNIEMTEGNFDQTLQSVLDSLPAVDFIFVDGNHRREPTLRYFYQFLDKINPQSILIFDDIHWSAEMEQAWEIIKSHDAVRCSIDLFFIGIVFFRKEFMEKQHFSIRF
jgi:predicted O-methyltransferase YrrM